MTYPTDLPSYDPIVTPITLHDLHHTNRHSQEEADIVALATKLGISGSAVTSTVDYKLATVIGGLATHIANVSNPHSVTKSQVGLGNVNNTSDAVKQLAFLAAAYPIGSIYMNSTSSTNPGTLLGFGTWVAFAAGRVLIGVGTSDQTFAAAATGGESTHALTTAELATHTHSVGGGQNQFVHGGAGSDANASLLQGGSAYKVTGVSTGTDSAGSGTAHNNLSPYIVVYMWARTA